MRYSGPADAPAAEILDAVLLEHNADPDLLTATALALGVGFLYATQLRERGWQRTAAVIVERRQAKGMAAVPARFLLLTTTAPLAGGAVEERQDEAAAAAAGIVQLQTELFVSNAHEKS